MLLLQILDDGEYELTRVPQTKPYPYAILSHTWRQNEITMLDVESGQAKGLDGWDKIQFCGEQTLRDGLCHFWIDSCCIDRRSSAILDEAINSMFRWYQEADKCYVYLDDVYEGEGWEDQFRASRWFKRGWTLQELLAPRHVGFYSREGKYLGDRGSLETIIHEVTRIPKAALQGLSLDNFGAEEKMKWTEGRSTTLGEDQAWCLLGIFNVSLVSRYGIGEVRAKAELQDAIWRSADAIKAAVKAWLSPLDFTTTQQSFYRNWTPGTCQWFLDSEPFATWKDPAPALAVASKLCGVQEVLATGSQRLQATLDSSLSKAVLSIFCRHDDQEAQSLVNLFGSLLRQIVEIPERALNYSLRRRYENARIDGTRPNARPPSLENDIYPFLVDILSEFGVVYIIVDGLDECSASGEQSTRTMLVLKLQELLHHENMNVRLLITTRPDLESYQLCEWPVIEISAADEDISRYLRTKIGQKPRISGMKADEKIIQTITRNAEGMFLIASLYWREISSAMNPGKLKSILDGPPRTAEDLYARTLRRIGELPGDQKLLAHRLLAWVYAAIRPFKVAELQHALVMATSNSSKFDEDWITQPNDLQDLGCGLIVIEGTGLVRFDHFTVKEFLASRLSKLELPNEPSKDLAINCLRYLTLDDFATTPEDVGLMIQRMERMYFLRYAAKYWHMHNYRPIGEADIDQELNGLLQKLFLEEDQAYYLNWLRVDNPNWVESWMGERPGLTRSQLPPPTFYTAIFKLPELGEKVLLEKQGQPNLLLEELLGHLQRDHYEDSVRLLNQGLCPNLVDPRNGITLLCACSSVRLITLLLDRGADPNARADERGWNPLQCLARNGHFDSVKLLHSRGAKVPPDPGYESAMHHAVYFGHYEITKYLLENGADRDVNVDGEMGPLPHWAAAHGQLQILQLLVDYDADLEASWMYKGRKYSVMEWLMGCGMRYAVQNKLSGWGMGNQHQEVGLYLLRGRISLEQIRSARNIRGETVIQWATRMGFTDIVKEMDTSTFK